MSSHEFTIDTHDLDAGGKEFRFPVRAAWVRGALEGHEATAEGTDGSLEVRASRSGTDVVVHGHVKAHLVVPCARCLEPVKLPIDKDVSALFVPPAEARKLRAPVHGKPAPRTAKGKDADAKAAKKSAKPADAGEDEVELSPDDMDVLPMAGDEVILDGLIRDELVLETPMIPLCSEDCPGINLPPPLAGGPGTAGGDADEAPPLDPRLAPLARLREQLAAPKPVVNGTSSHHEPSGPKKKRS